MDQTPKIEKHYRPDQIASLLCLSRSYVYFLIQSGELQAVTFGKGGTRARAVRVPASSLEKYLSRLRDGE